MNLPSQCANCPVANLLKRGYDEAAKQESAAMRLEVEARMSCEPELASIASSALAKVSYRRMIAEAGMAGIKHCGGYDGRCAKGYPH